jgi:hypothetical protein
MRITDDCGSRPADEIVILPHANFLNELKRKSDGKIALSDLKENQLKGLLDFDRAGENNFGMVLVSFQDSVRDTAYAIWIKNLLNLYKQMGVLYATETALATSKRAVPLPRSFSLITGEPCFDLRGLVDWCK